MLGCVPFRPGKCLIRRGWESGGKQNRMANVATPNSALEQRSAALGDPDGAEISLKPFFRILWSYRRVIAVLISIIITVLTLGALGVYLFQPTERQTSLEFRLHFEGADRGEYPNGLIFSQTDIISPSVLGNVYTQNALQRYCSYDDFKNSIVVLESSRELELLRMEYETKLGDSRLTPVDRSKLEQEFRQKQDTLRIPQYTLTFVTPSNSLQIPEILKKKILADILASWAEDAVKRKGILNYQVRIFTPSGLFRDMLDTEDYAIRFDMLRDKINRVIGNIDALSQLPGANVIRVTQDRVSLPEIRANLEDIRRFKVEPLALTMRSISIGRDPTSAAQYLQTRLLQVKSDQQESVARLATVRNALQSYTFARSDVATPQQSGPSTSSPTGGMIPQLSETFLDRLMDIARQNKDIEYRQKLTDEIIKAGERLASIEKEVAYYQQSAGSIQRQAGGIPSQDSLATFGKRFDEIYRLVVQAMDQVNAVYEEISKENLDPRTNLYSITTPPWSTTLRGFPASRLAVYEILTFVLSLWLIPLGCVIYDYFRREIYSPPVTAEVQLENPGTNLAKGRARAGNQ